MKNCKEQLYVPKIYGFIHVWEVVWIAMGNNYSDCHYVPAICVRQVGLEGFRVIFMVWHGVSCGRCSPVNELMLSFWLGCSKPNQPNRKTANQTNSKRNSKKLHLICMYLELFFTQPHCLVRFAVFYFTNRTKMVLRQTAT